MLYPPLQSKQWSWWIQMKYIIFRSTSVAWSLLVNKQVMKKALQLYLEEDSLAEYITTLISESVEDFPEEDGADPAAQHAAEITQASITDGTHIVLWNGTSFLYNQNLKSE